MFAFVAYVCKIERAIEEKHAVGREYPILSLKLEASVEKCSISRSRACLHDILPGFCVGNIL